MANTTHLIGGPDTGSLARVQCVHIAVLLRQEPGRHTRPRGEDDERDEVGKHQGTSDRLEGWSREEAERVTEKDNGRWDVDHGVCPIRSVHQRKANIHGRSVLVKEPEQSR